MYPNSPEVKSEKTVRLFGMVNLMLSPLILINPTFALGAAIVANSLLIRHLHQLGQAQRPVAELMRQGSGFFTAASIDGTVSKANNNSALQNVIDGGAALYDGIIFTA